MSWDILIQDFPNVATTGEIPDDYAPTPLGPRSELIARIVESFPEADFSNPAWGLIDASHWSVEVNVGDDEICESLMLHVRGDGGEAVPAVATIIKSLGARAIDMQTGEFFNASTAQASFDQWRAYRDQVVAAGSVKRPASPRRGFFSRFFH